jgi:hypothetical protein
VRVEVTAGGLAASWHFPGSLAFDVWAQRLPWCSQGGLGVIRTADASYQDAIASSIARSVRGLHGDRGYLDVRVAPCGGELAGPFASVLQSLEVTPTLGPFEAREPLRVALQDRACVFILTEAGPVSSAEWEAFVSLIEHYGKASPPIRLCAVVLDSQLSVVSEPSFDFSSGWAEIRLLSLASELDDLQVWQAYLHQRACWEAAGSPSYASEVGESLADVRVGDDDAVESVLTSFAEATARPRFDLRLVGSLVLEASRRQQDPGRQRRARDELQRLGVMWLPPSGSKLEVRPWVSRALLREPTISESTVWALRHNLVCVPLANEVIAHCLRAEAQIRTLLHGRAQEDAPQQSWAYLRRFTDGVEDFVHYPLGYPLPPVRREDVWAFASLGEVLHACPRGAVSDLFRDTLKLRNALTHGHYVNWRHLMHAKRQAYRFDVT